MTATPDPSVLSAGVKKITSAILLLGLSSCGRPALPAPEDQPLVLEALDQVDSTGSIRPGMSILIRQGRISAIYPTGSRSLPPGARTMSLAGKYVIPGLIDAHVHLTAPFERTGQQDSLSEFFLRGGITAIRDMAGNGAVLRERAREAQSGSALSPRIYYSTVVASAHHFATDRRAASLARGAVPGEVPWARSVGSESDAVVAAWDADSMGATGIKVYAELTPELLRAVVRAAHARGLKVWSHATVVPAKPSDAVSAGVDVLSHAFMLVLEARDWFPLEYSASFDAYDYPAFPASGPAFSALFADMARRGTMLDPTLSAIRRLVQSQRVLEGDLSMLQGADAWGIEATRLAHQAGVTIVAGTDVSGYPGQDSLPTLHDELAMYVEDVGLTPADALATATSNAARMLGVESDIGTIAPGRLADLVILDGNPLTDIRNTRRIAYVVKGGVVHPVEHAHASPDPVTWTASWPGTQMAIVNGNPFGSGPFAFRFRMPDGYWICPHRHPLDARIRVVEGTFLVGMGDSVRLAGARVVAAGAEIGVGAGMSHFEGARGVTVIEVQGTGPWGVTFLDPRYDPAQAGAQRCEPH